MLRRCALKRSALALSVLLTVTACGQTSNAPPAPTTTSVRADATSPAPPDRWHPTHKIPLVVMSEEEMNRIRIEQIAALAKQLDLGSPEVPALIRWIYPEDIGTTIVPCLRDKGFDVTPNAAGNGYSTGVSRAQEKAFGLAEWQCSAMYTIDSRITLPPTTAQYGIDYDYVKEFLLPCLAKLGYADLELPSKEVYLASGGWTGYPRGDMTAQARCPRNPPAYAVLGEDSP